MGPVHVIILQIGLALDVDLVILEETVVAFNVELRDESLRLPHLVEAEKLNDRVIGIVLVDFWFMLNDLLVEVAAQHVRSLVICLRNVIPTEDVIVIEMLVGILIRLIRILIDLLFRGRPIL
jgi:hypothetical protein